VTTQRAEQRRLTEHRILTAARKLFSANGYDRTTIRAVATEAETDPGLVMRYFGSKENLFSRVARIDADEPIAGTPDEVADAVLVSLTDKLGDEPVAALAMLRSMLTHPDASRGVHNFMTEQQQQIAATLPRPDATLRAGLMMSVLLGTVVGRYLIKVDGLDDAIPEEIGDLLRPCFRALAGGDAGSAAAE